MKHSVHFLLLLFSTIAFADEFDIDLIGEKYSVSPSNIETFDFVLDAEDDGYEVSVTLILPSSQMEYVFTDAYVGYLYKGEQFGVNIDPLESGNSLSLNVHGHPCMLNNTRFWVRYLNSEDEINHYFINLNEFFPSLLSDFNDNQC